MLVPIFLVVAFVISASIISHRIDKRFNNYKYTETDIMICGDSVRKNRSWYEL